MARVIATGGRYYDKETGEYILIESVDDVITYVFESDGETDAWAIEDVETFAEHLVPANDIAVMAERGMDIKVKKLHPDAIIPEYKTLGAVGFDLHITEDVTIPPNRVVVKYVGEGNDKDIPFNFDDFEFVLANDNHAVAGTGLAFEIPIGYELEIRSRSGNVFKDIKVFAYNGTIDSDFRGEVKLLLTNLGKEAVTFKKGDRVAQGIIKRIEQVNFIEADELSSTDRGDKGFGSTGVK
jgi:dUTP pyrophosphatase